MMKRNESLICMAMMYTIEGVGAKNSIPRLADNERIRVKHV
jgi:hypothetical protein